MYIEITKGIEYNGVKAGETLLLKIEYIEKYTDKIRVKVNTYVKSKYQLGLRQYGLVPGIRSIYEFNEIENQYKTVALVHVFQELLNEPVLDLNVEDMNMLAELDWKHPERSIRLSIPVNEVIDNDLYNSLVASLKAGGTPNYKENGNRILYLEEIFPEHQALLYADPCVIIETYTA